MKKTLKLVDVENTGKLDALKVRLQSGITDYNKAIKTAAKKKEFGTVLSLSSEMEAFMFILNTVIPQIEKE